MYIFPQLVCFKCLCWSGRFLFHSYLKDMWAGGNSWSCSSVLAICYLQMQKTYLLKFRAAVFNDKMITSISSFSRELSHHRLCKGKTLNCFQWTGWKVIHSQRKDTESQALVLFAVFIQVSSWGEESLKDLHTPQNQTYSGISLVYSFTLCAWKPPF